MTRKERVAQIQPEMIRECFIGGVAGCPSGYPYLHDSREITQCDSRSDCVKCWDAEWIPERED